MRIRVRAPAPTTIARLVSDTRESRDVTHDTRAIADTGLMQIGDVAERTGLSLRTIRHYEEVGLVTVQQRSPGGFRLYGGDAVERLLLIKQMKPLDFTLEQMREMLEIRDRLASPRLSAKTRAGLLDKLSSYQILVEHNLIELRRKVANAEAFAAQLREPVA